MKQTVTRLLDEAAAAPVAGWDFAWAFGRIATVVPLPWDFTALAAGALRSATAAVDRGTGGGEFVPFKDAAFDLVLNRHEAFAAAEVARVLASGGRFLTQQAASVPDQFHALLGLEPPARTAFDLDLLVGQVVRAGLSGGGPRCSVRHRCPGPPRGRCEGRSAPSG